MAARKFDQARLDELVEAAKASEHPYKALEGKPFNLSASIARTVVVGSGLSKSRDEVRDREAERIKRWLEAGEIGGNPKAAPKPESAPVAESAPDTEAAPDERVEIPGAAAAGVDAAYAEAERIRKRTPRKPWKDGQASNTAKAIARNRKPVAATE